MAQSVFGSAIDYARVRIRRRKWFLLQPRRTAMAPQGHIHFHPTGRIAPFEIRVKAGIAGNTAAVAELCPGDILPSGACSTLPPVRWADYGLSVGGIRHESPDAAAAAVGHRGDGWAFWRIDDGHGPKPLSELE